VSCLPPVQVIQRLADRLVQFGEAEEAPVPEAGQDPALEHLDADLHLGLVAWLAGPRRYDRRAVMGRHVGIGAVDLGVIEAGPGDPRLEVVGHHLAGHAAKESEGAGVRFDPVGQRLGPGGLDVGVARRAEGGDEHLGGMDLAGQAVDYVEGGAGVIDEHLLASHVSLAHGQGEPAPPGAIEVAEPAVAVPVRMNRPVLFPQKGQGHAGLPQRAMQGRPVGERPTVRGQGCRRREQQPVQFLVRKLLG